MGIEIFADRLKEAMNIRGMKQRDLVKMIGVPKSTISLYVNGKRKPINYSRLIVISRALKVNPAWLVGLDVPMERESVLVSQDERLKVNRFINELDEESFNKLKGFLNNFFGYKEE